MGGAHLGRGEGALGDAADGGRRQALVEGQAQLLPPSDLRGERGSDGGEGVVLVAAAGARGAGARAEVQQRNGAHLAPRELRQGPSSLSTAAPGPPAADTQVIVSWQHLVGPRKGIFPIGTFANGDVLPTPRIYFNIHEDPQQLGHSEGYHAPEPKKQEIKSTREEGREGHNNAKNNPFVKHPKHSCQNSPHDTKDE